MSEQKAGIDELRHIVRNFNDCNETFNTSYTLDQLVKIHRAWQASGWDISPDHWTTRQLREALKGTAPQWDDAEKPVYMKKGSRDWSAK